MTAFLYIILICILITALLVLYFKLSNTNREVIKWKEQNDASTILLKSIQNEVKKNNETIALQENLLRIKTKDIIIKSRELDEKNHLIGLIKTKISDAQQNPAKIKNRVHEIDLELEHFLKVEDHTFEMQMDELNQAFMKLLKSKFPEITPHDQRICLYIKTGMSSLEMAALMNVLPSSIYISRSRLRKKLGLEMDQDLYGFLTKLS